MSRDKNFGILWPRFGNQSMSEIQSESSRYLCLLNHKELFSMVLRFMRKHSTPLWWRKLIGRDQRPSNWLKPVLTLQRQHSTYSVSSPALGPVTPAALISSSPMFAAPRTRSPVSLGCTLSSHYFCYSNLGINYALE